MATIRRLADIRDDIDFLVFPWDFSESLVGFKFSENVHTIYITSGDVKLVGVELPNKLKTLYMSPNYNDFTGAIIPEDLQNLHIQFNGRPKPIIGLNLPPKLIELTLYGCKIDNLVFPALKILKINASDVENCDFNHELYIISRLPIRNHKFEYVKFDDGWHYIYLKWPKTHFIKAATN
jgi:hypothetical protein